MTRNARIILFLVAFLLLPAVSPAKSQVGPRLKEYMTKTLLPHLWHDTKTTFTQPETWMWIGVGAALTVGAHQYDWQVNDYWKDHKQMYGLSDFGNDWWGAGELQGALALSMTLAGWHFENEKLANAGEVLIEAQIIQGVIINVIKPIANKERPNGSSNLSFPSGHTGTAFCTAAVLHDRFGWGVAVPLYTAAVITAMSRMDVQAHWLSDTVMGATIAMVTGYSVSRYHDDYPWDIKWGKSSENPSARVMVLPAFLDGKPGLSITAMW